MNRLILFFLFTLLLSSSLYAKKKHRSWSELRSKADHLLFDTKKEIWVEKIDTTIPMYVACAFVTMKLPFEKAAPIFMDFDNYSDIFDYVHVAKNVSDTINTWDTSTIYYAEGKAPLVHGWGLGKIDTIIYKPSQMLALKVRPVDKMLHQAYRRDRKGKIRYYVKDIHIDGQLIKIDDNYSRIGILAWSDTNKPMPLWLVNFIMKIVMPGFVKDVIKYAKKHPDKYTPEPVLNDSISVSSN